MLVEINAMSAEQLAVLLLKRASAMVLLLPLDELSLGKSSRQRRDNMNVIGDTADAHKFGPEIAADRRQIRVHSRSHVGIEEGLAILRTKNDVKDDLTE
jgi:hypothetical protein